MIAKKFVLGRLLLGACHPPGSQVDWCNGVRPDAVFTESWSAFVWQG